MRSLVFATVYDLIAKIRPQNVPVYDLPAIDSVIRQSANPES